MINKSEYKQAHLELYEIIKKFSLEDRKKIPKDFIEFLKANMDTNYSFKYDDTKSLNESIISTTIRKIFI